MIAIINGPNLNLLGRRNPEIYGSTSFDDFMPQAESLLAALSPSESLVYFQSNSEGELVDMIQEFGFDPECKGIVFNPGAYAHYSYALHDAIEAVPAPAVEVHISNIHAREEFRHKDVVAPACRGMICGLGLDGYLLAIRHLVSSDKD